MLRVVRPAIVYANATRQKSRTASGKGTGWLGTGAGGGLAFQSILSLLNFAPSACVST